MMFDLTDRSNCFYWQTDRNLSPEDYRRIFLQRHEIPTKTLAKIIKNGLKTLGKIKAVKIEDPDENVVKGNVNIVRKVKINNQPYVVRMHPNKVKNGYFYSEKMALIAAFKNGLPVPTVVEIHESTDENDMDFMLMTQSPGKTMAVLLEEKTELEKNLLIVAGKVMANIHHIKVDGFGPFDNQQAKNGKLIGIHNSYHNFIHAGLEENIKRLMDYKVVDEKQAKNFRAIFTKQNFEPIAGARLIHNDFADWNLLTDDKKLTGILDWDECHAGDPVADLACWSTFFDLNRLKTFMKGYTQIATLPDDYEQRFHFYRLRYTISKMALRIKRYQVDRSELITKLLEAGKQALKEELDWLQVKS